MPSDQRSHLILQLLSASDARASCHLSQRRSHCITACTQKTGLGLLRRFPNVDVVVVHTELDDFSFAEAVREIKCIRSDGSIIGISPGTYREMEGADYSTICFSSSGSSGAGCCCTLAGIARKQLPRSAMTRTMRPSNCGSVPRAPSKVFPTFVGTDPRLPVRFHKTLELPGSRQQNTLCGEDPNVVGSRNLSAARVESLVSESNVPCNELPHHTFIYQAPPVSKRCRARILATDGSLPVTIRGCLREHNGYDSANPCKYSDRHMRASGVMAYDASEKNPSGEGA
jgi:hypothetical protein